MSEKKKMSQAEKAAATAMRRTKGEKASSAPKEKKAEPAVKGSECGFRLPARVISSVVFLLFFIIFLWTAFRPAGSLWPGLEKLFQGLLGRAGFYVAIPGFLYLFLIHAFSGKRPVVMRSVCVAVFVVLCGCISHMILQYQFQSKGLAVLGELYKGGSLGNTGGVLCGILAMPLQKIFGNAFTYLVLAICAIFALLGAMQITIPSIIRAIQNRPRAEWEIEKDAEEVQEPAAMVVNHIANKRIERMESQRKQAENAPEAKKKSRQKASEIMRQIDADVEAPVAAADHPVVAEAVDDMDPQQLLQPVVTVDVPVENVPVPAAPEEIPEDIPAPVVPDIAPQEPVPEKVTAKDARASAEEVAQEIAEAQLIEQPEYCFPPMELLRLPGRSAGDGTAEMRENAKLLNDALASYKIEAHITNVTRGPSVTRYEVELEKGVRLNKLTTAADDIALSLGATSVRIAAIPGKISIVGIEVPNNIVTTVSLREVIDSAEFKRAKSKSSFSVGKDIGGTCIIGNITKLPHMLIAGTTGSGKSVCMNSIIISLLYKASPEDVKLIMVDPKMVELRIYDGIPHLLIPVVTDPKKAAGSLQWAVTEMLRRYRAMSDAGVRDLESYNAIMAEQEDGKKLPQVVVIIDELADLMLVAAKEVEESICRIAQMGRAAGIHLIIATQRPSADVITGLMKANIPSRIAFAVSSAMESRIILDSPGAEKLVGKGDMLYAPIGNGKPMRVQGCFVSESEVEAVVSYVKANFVSNYDQQVMEEIERNAIEKQPAPESEPTAEETERDEMLPQAVDVILEIGQASVSMLQRRLKLGYSRAARIVDEMEEMGIVGPYQGSKPRAILITREQWELMRSGASQNTQMAFDDLEDPYDGDDEDDE